MVPGVPELQCERCAAAPFYLQYVVSRVGDVRQREEQCGEQALLALGSERLQSYGALTVIPAGLRQGGFLVGWRAGGPLPRQPPPVEEAWRRVNVLSPISPVKEWRSSNQ